MFSKCSPRDDKSFTTHVMIKITNAVAINTHTLTVDKQGILSRPVPNFTKGRKYCRRRIRKRRLYVGIYVCVGNVLQKVVSPVVNEDFLATYEICTQVHMKLLVFTRLSL